MASLSDFTNGDKFKSLISKIDMDITSSNVSNMMLNNQVVQLSGSTIASNVATSSTGIKELDKVANQLGAAADQFKSNISSNINSAISAVGLDRPQVVNLSAKGPLAEGIGVIHKVIDYLPPTTLAMTTFDKLGKSIDTMIKDSLIVQMFNIKGTDILCTTLCLVLSILPCQVSNKIVDGIQEIKEIQSSVNSGLQMARAAESFGLGELNAGLSGGITGLANINDVKTSLNSAFKIDKGGSKQQQIAQSIKSVTAQFSTLIQVLNLLVSVAKIGWNDPKAVVGYLVNGMFDLLENVLLAVQAMAVQMADKIINKVIAPIEKYFKKVPELCGIGAQLLFRKILSIIYQFKNSILKFIADLFSFDKAIRTKFELFNRNLSWTLELSALLKVLQLLLNNFLDIAIACGPVKRPCSDGTGPNISQIYNDKAGFTEDGLIYNNPINTTVLDLIDLPPQGTINQMAMKLQPMVDSIFPGSNNQLSTGEVRTDMKDTPYLISKLLGDIDLGSNITVYKNNNDATIVYNNSALCGAN